MYSPKRKTITLNIGTRQKKRRKKIELVRQFFKTKHNPEEMSKIFFSISETIFENQALTQNSCEQKKIELVRQFLKTSAINHNNCQL
jgi:hypothetical protein